MVEKKKFRYIIAVCLIMLLSTASVASGMFPDVNGHWAEQTIVTMYENNVVKGYSGNLFKPNSSITRAEFISIINRYYNYSALAEVNYSDVDTTAWYWEEVAKANAAGYIKGFEDNTFRPNERITRQEAAVMIAKIESLELEGTTDDLHKFSDVGVVKQWAFNSINALVHLGIITGYPDKTLNPEGYITRAEAVSLL